MIHSIANNTPLTISRQNANTAQPAFPTRGAFSARVAERRENNQFLFEALEHNFSFNASLAHDAQVGDVFDFEPVENQGQLTLKLINKTQGSMNEMTSLSTTDLKTLFEKSGFSQEINVSEDYIDSGQLESDRQIAALKRQLSKDESLLTTGVVNQLLAKGVDVSAIDVTQIKTASQQADAVLYVPTGEPKADMTGALESHHLPVNADNLSTLQKTYDYYQKAVAQTQPQAIANLLGSGKPLTLGNLYNATVSAPHYEQKVDAFDNLDQELAKLYTRQDIEATPENLAYGKYLFEAEAEITKDNLALLDKLLNLPYYPVLDSACVAIKKGENITDILLAQVQVDDTAIYNNYANTLAMLGQADALTPVGALYQHYQAYEPAEQTLDQLTFQKNLAQVQLKLTAEAAYALASAGIDINIQPVQQAVEHLQALEAQAYEKLALEKHVPVEQIPVVKETLGELFDGIKNISPFYPQAYKYTVDNYQDFNISALDKQTTAAKLSDGYSAQMTTPVAKYGDTFAKVYDQLNAVVTGIGMPDTEENIRLASILSRAGLDVNQDNMLEAKLIHKKLDYVVDNLHPSVAIDMIQAGVSPFTAHMDELIDFIDTHYPLHERNTTKKLAEHILDIQDSIDPAMREQVMAVYRSLRQINKFGAVSVGISMQTGTELTLAHLLDAADYFGGSRRAHSQGSTYIDTNTDQPQATPASTNIRQTLAELSGKEALSKLTPDMIVNAELNTPLSEVYNQAEQAQQATEAKQTKLDTILQDIAQTAEQLGAINLLKQAGQQATTQNIKDLVMLIEQPNQLKTKLDKLKNQLDADQIPSSPDAYLSDEGLFETLSTHLEQLSELPVNPETPTQKTTPEPVGYTPIDLQDISVLQNSLRFQQQLSPSAYTLPINLGGVVSTLQMSVNGRLSTASNIVISLDTPQYGNLTTLIRTNGTDIDIFANSDNQTLLDKLSGEADQLANHFQLAGFSLKNVITNTQITDTTSNTAEQTSASYGTDAPTRDGLFKLATSLVNYLNS